MNNNESTESTEKAIKFRVAQEGDLGAVYEVYYLNEVLGHDNPPALGTVPPYLPHVLRTGKLVLAEQEGRVLGFAGTITHAGIAFLTDLFVRPDVQSGQIGQQLLQMALPQDGLVHCTLSSNDLRALALYIRAGMQPQWPLYILRMSQPTRALSGLNPEIEVSQADAADPELVRWDARVCGRSRAEDLQFWVREQHGEALWFRKRGQIVGYAFIRLDAGSLWYPQACMVGPLGVAQAEDATACVLAALNLALQRSDVVRIHVPGPHPCLAPLLEQGFYITYVDTFVSTAPFFDASRYIPSGEDLF
ncbi:MAG: hypothetical protein NVS2B12_34320 [Ktedonobacteraceae bacterium]